MRGLDQLVQEGGGRAWLVEDLGVEELAEHDLVHVRDDLETLAGDEEDGDADEDEAEVGLPLDTVDLRGVTFH